jgi:hypothetical protein
MLRYKLRTLLIVLALGPPVLAGGWCPLSSPLLAGEPVPITEESYWVVSDAYFLNKPRRSQVGMTIVFWKGEMYCVNKDGSRSDIQRLTVTRSEAGWRFTCKSDSTGIGGKGLIVKTSDDCIWVYLNVNDRDYDAIPWPDAAVDKAEGAFRCLKLDKQDALKELEMARVELK